MSQLPSRDREGAVPKINCSAFTNLVTTAIPRNGLAPKALTQLQPRQLPFLG